MKVRTLTVVQARMGSSRLPGKVLLPLAGKPTILRILERIGRATLSDHIVVATTTQRDDDRLSETVLSAGFDVFRGSCEDVLSRFVGLVNLHTPSAIVRITADCPLTSPTMIDAMVQRFYSTNSDYLSNALKPTFPDGLDIEVVRPEALLQVDLLARSQRQREHVTMGIYQRPTIFKIDHYVGSQDLSSWRWTVDVAEDYAFVSWLFSEMHARDPHFDWQDTVRFLLDRPHMIRTDSDEPRNAGSRGA